MATTIKEFKYNWFSIGDIGAAVTIIFDNLTILLFISLILGFGYEFPTNIIMNHIIPGTIIGVLVGNILFFWLSFRLAKREKRNVTAMPFGLDAPSAIGFAVLIIGPAFVQLKKTGIGEIAAGLNAWHIGVSCLVITGLIKLFFSFFANKIKNFIPQAALLGSVSGVAIALIGFLPLVSIFRIPMVGLLSLAIVFIAMFAKVRLPFNIPSIPVAVLIGVLAYYLLIPFGLSGPIPDVSFSLQFLLPLPNFSVFNFSSDIWTYVPIIIPFSLLVIFGSMSVAESALCMGENYKARDLIVIDSIATIISAIFGGVSQTTPYAGFPAYKHMNARAGFLLLNIIVVGIGGLLGIVSLIVHLVPESAIAPVLLYVAFEIFMQGFIQCDKKYYPAILFAIFPSIARLLEIKFTDGSIVPSDQFQDAAFASSKVLLSDNLVIMMLGNGFIVTGALWAATLVFVIDRKWWSGFFCTVILAILSYFGVIHSFYASGKISLPSSLPESLQKFPLEISFGYLLFGIIVLIFSRFKTK